MTSHHIFGPSRADRQTTCKGSEGLIRLLNLPDTGSSSFAAEGTAAHELADLAARRLPMPEAGSTITVGEFDVVVTDEMRECAQKWAEYLHDNEGDHDILLTEQRVKIPLPHYDGPVIFGTTDAAILRLQHDGTYQLVVGDYKYGRGVPVSALRNLQMIMYGWGVYQNVQTFAEVSSVRLFIMQPRLSWEADVWDTTVDELQSMIDDISSALATAHRLYEGQDEAEILRYLTPDAKACKFCPAKGACPALAKKVLSEFTDLDADLGLTAKPLTPAPTVEAIARWYPLLPMLREWADAVEKMATELALGGTALPGLKLVEGRKGARAWADEAEAMAELVDAIGEAAFEKKLLSPAKAEKVLGKGKKDLLPDTKQSAGTPVLVQDDDKRPAITRADGFDDLTA